MDFNLRRDMKSENRGNTLLPGRIASVFMFLSFVFSFFVLSIDKFHNHVMININSKLRILFVYTN